MSGDWKTPGTEVRVVTDRTGGSRADEGFLRIKRLLLRNRYEDGAESADYAYDVVVRTALDAVAIVLASGPEDAPLVCLRSAIRPPLALRDADSVPLPPDGETVLWEVPAGIVEIDEKGEDGILRCAARETLEETGFDVPPERFTVLGRPVYLSPGMVAEMIHFVVARVDAAERGVPTEDGSPTEERAVVRFVPLREALAACENGLIRDAKTEIALRRFAAGRAT